MKYQHGQTIIELLLAFAFSVIFLPALFTMFFVSREGKPQEIQRAQAVLLAREAEEALRSIREAGWEQFALYAIATAYHPNRSGNAWALASGTETVNGFTRQIIFSQVYRNQLGVIVVGSGTLDPSTRRATVTVSWPTPLASSVVSSLIVTRHNNIIVTDTTDTDFQLGTLAHTKVTKLSDGEVVLGSTGGKGDWCAPNLSIAALDLPKNGVANAISAVQGDVIAGTGENSSGVSFANILVTDTSPPTSSVSGTFDGYKTNGVFNDANYAYIATDNHSKEMIILDLNQLDPVTKKYAEVGYFNAPGNNNGKSVSVSGNIGFLTVNNILYTIDLSSKSGSRPQLASKTLTANGTKVVVNGSYAFVSIAGATQELQIVQFNAAGTTLTITGSADVNGQAAYDVSVNATGTRAYLATGVDPSKPEFFIIDTTSKSGNRPNIGSYNANGMDPKAVAIVTSSKAVLVGTGAEEYQVIDITDEAHPVRCGGLNINTGVNGVAAVLESDGDAYAYIITGDSADELKIIEGGPGSNGKDYYLSGTFDSKAFDATTIATGSSQAAFNRISATITKAPSITDLKLQVAAADAVNNSCTNAVYVFVGPDGTAGTYYTSLDGTTISGVIPFSDDGAGFENPARCFKYRAYLTTTDSALTPILSDLSISLSP